MIRSKLPALRLGFGGMIALLLLSALEAYRIQERAARQTAEIYHRFVQQGEALSHVRRLLFIGSIYTRDFFLNPAPGRAEIFRKQIAELETEANGTLEELQKSIGRAESFDGLRRSVRGFWETLEHPLAWPESERRKRAFEFVQTEVAPRRDATGEIIQNIRAVNQQALVLSEAEFAGSGRTAVLWHSAIVALSLILALAVSRFSLSYAGRMERESARAFDEVEQAKKDLEQLSARLLDIQEDERRRLSRELHDEVGQALTALRIEIAQAQSACRTAAPDAAERLEQARAVAEKTLRTVRDISLLLRPSLLDDLGLEPALQWQAEDFSRRSSVACVFAEEGLDDDLPEPFRTCVYRVVQEALNNCEKHSGATEVLVTVKVAAGTLTADIRDNGHGFEVDRHGFPVGRAGLGILGMRERVGALGGTLTLESAAGAGTRVFLTLPLGAQAASAQMAG